MKENNKYPEQGLVSCRAQIAIFDVFPEPLILHRHGKIVMVTVQDSGTRILADLRQSERIENPNNFQVL